MKKKYELSVFIFTRDLRLYDNLPLINALKNSNYVIPIFILNPNQLDDKINKYKSNNAVQFMCETLSELNTELNDKGSRLFYFVGDYLTVLKTLIEKYKYKKECIDAVYISKDYTKFATKRENDINKLCNDLGVDFIIEENHMLTGIDKVLKSDGTPYVKFTPYYTVAKKLKVQSPIDNKFSNYLTKKEKLPKEFEGKLSKFYEKNDNILVRGGRKNGLKILKNIKDHKNYNTDREIPSIKGTTYLSAYNKFGVVSIREVYQSFKKNLSSSNKLFTELYWRDFYLQNAYYYPHVFSGPMRKEYTIKWENNKKYIKAWQEGKTGIPIIDAAMRQMNMTGYMHNRCRMIVANFFIKILRCDWRIGEKYFAQSLTDYDPSVNNLSWQWSASTAVDSQPYFRVFNPWRQMQTYDKNCEYIKKWIPELKNVDNKHILDWNNYYDQYEDIKYPKPIISNINAEVKKTIKIYEAI